MRYYLRSLWSGGVVVGGAISAVGLAQWVYETTTQRPLEIHIQWYSLVIIGLVIMLVFSLRKAYSLHKKELYEAKVEAERERHILADKFRQLSRFPMKGAMEPLSLDITIKSDDRSLADIFPEIPKNKKGIIYPMVSMSAGLIQIRNNSLEPVDIEIEYEVVGGNVPIFLQNRVDNTPIFSQNRPYRTDTVNPKERRDVCFAIYGLVDRFHKGFKFPSYLSSNSNKLGWHVEGRITTYKSQQLRYSARSLPYVDIRLRVIATSAINVGKVTENTFGYRMKANPRTNEITLTPREKG